MDICFQYYNIYIIRGYFDGSLWTIFVPEDEVKGLTNVSWQSNLTTN